MESGGAQRSRAARSRFARSRIDAEAFDRVTRVTYGGAVDAVRAALPHLERSRGVVVAVGSVNSKAPLPTFTGYSSSKYALRGFLLGLRLELQAEKAPVAVTIVHPGAVDTPLWRQVTSTSGFLPRTPPLSASAGEIAPAWAGASP